MWDQVEHDTGVAETRLLESGQHNTVYRLTDKLEIGSKSEKVMCRIFVICRKQCNDTITKKDTG